MSLAGGQTALELGLAGILPEVPTVEACLNFSLLRRLPESTLEHALSALGPGIYRHPGSGVWKDELDGKSTEKREAARHKRVQSMYRAAGKRVKQLRPTQTETHSMNSDLPLFKRADPFVWENRLRNTSPWGR